jgi:hypothetical protein
VGARGKGKRRIFRREISVAAIDIPRDLGGIAAGNQVDGVAGALGSAYTLRVAATASTNVQFVRAPRATRSCAGAGEACLVVADDVGMRRGGERGV